MYPTRTEINHQPVYGWFPVFLSVHTAIPAAPFSHPPGGRSPLWARWPHPAGHLEKGSISLKDHVQLNVTHISSPFTLALPKQGKLLVLISFSSPLIFYHVFFFVCVCVGGGGAHAPSPPPPQSNLHHHHSHNLHHHRSYSLHHHQLQPSPPPQSQLSPQPPQSQLLPPPVTTFTITTTVTTITTTTLTTITTTTAQPSSPPPWSQPSSPPQPQPSSPPPQSQRHHHHSPNLHHTTTSPPPQSQCSSSPPQSQRSSSPPQSQRSSSPPQSQRSSSPPQSQRSSSPPQSQPSSHHHGHRLTQLLQCGLQLFRGAVVGLLHLKDPLRQAGHGGLAECVAVAALIALLVPVAVVHGQDGGVLWCAAEVCQWHPWLRGRHGRGALQRAEFAHVDSPVVRPG